MARRPASRRPQPVVPLNAGAGVSDISHDSFAHDEWIAWDRRPVPATGQEAIEAQARDIADAYDVTVEDARCCLKRLVETFAPNLREHPSELEGALPRFPLRLLADALDTLPTVRAVQLIQSADLPDLARRSRLAAWVFDADTPLYTVADLACHLDSFIAYLRRHRDFIIETGLPPEPFRPSPWLYHRLARLYDTQATFSPLPYAERCPRPRPGEPPYRWVQTPSNPCLGGDLRECDYGYADFLNGLNPRDAYRIEDERGRLFDVKVRLLDRVAQALRCRRADGLWADCVAGLIAGLSAEEIAFYLYLDRWYMGRDIMADTDFDDNPIMIAGGLTNWLELVGHVEEELAVGQMAAVRTVLDDDTLAGLDHLHDGVTSDRLYLAVLGRPEQQALDAALDGMLARQPQVEAFWRDYRRRVDAFIHGLREDVPVPVLACHAEQITPLVRRFAGHLEERLEKGKPTTGPFDPGDRPVWDAGRRELYFGGQIIRKLRRYGSSHLDTILATFAEDGWPSRIDDPVAHTGIELASAKRYENVKSLNAGLKAIEFFVEGEGYGWRLRPKADP